MLNRILATVTVLVLLASAGGMFYFYDAYQAANQQLQAEQESLRQEVEQLQADGTGPFAEQGKGARLLRYAPVSQGDKNGRFFREYHLEYILNAEHLCLAVMVSYEQHQSKIDSLVWMPAGEACL